MPVSNINHPTLVVTEGRVPVQRAADWRPPTTPPPTPPGRASSTSWRPTTGPGSDSSSTPSTWSSQPCANMIAWSEQLHHKLNSISTRFNPGLSTLTEWRWAPTAAPPHPPPSPHWPTSWPWSSHRMWPWRPGASRPSGPRCQCLQTQK